MKLKISIMAVMVFVAAGLYLYFGQSPAEKAAHEVEESASEESVLPDDLDNSDFDDIPTQQEPKSPERAPPVHFPTHLAALEKQLIPSLSTVNSVETELSQILIKSHS